MGLRSRLHISSWVMFSPYLFLLIMFGVVPIVLAFESSLGTTFLNPDGGLDNYLIVLQDFRFIPALRNVATFLLIYLPAMLIITLLIAILLDVRPSRSNKYLMTAYIVPAAITGSVAICAAWPRRGCIASATLSAQRMSPAELSTAPRLPRTQSSCASCSSYLCRSTRTGTSWAQSAVRQPRQRARRLRWFRRPCTFWSTEPAIWARLRTCSASI